jgi:hypothetical protein
MVAGTPGPAGTTVTDWSLTFIVSDLLQRFLQGPRTNGLRGMPGLRAASHVEWGILHVLDSVLIYVQLLKIYAVENIHQKMLHVDNQFVKVCVVYCVRRIFIHVLLFIIEISFDLLEYHLISRGRIFAQIP